MLDDRLRDEILESQRVQSQLAKWKLLAIAGVAATALGSIPGVPPLTRLAVLALLPLACLYVDVLTLHATVRIMTIARYVRTRGNRDLFIGRRDRLSDALMFEDYERYAHEQRQQFRFHFALETFAMVAVTFLACGTVTLVGVSDEVRKMLGVPGVRSEFTPKVLIYSGAIGFVLTGGFLFYHRYTMRCLSHPDDVHQTDEVLSVRAALEREFPEMPELYATSGVNLPVELTRLVPPDGNLRPLGAVIRLASLTGRDVFLTSDTEGGKQQQSPEPRPLLPPSAPRIVIRSVDKTQ
ncbi:MAG TPA: hypothetical protein VGF28_06895 [Thermoanaerobaculia bacterium]|jgi:hypothetical protein